MIKVSKQKWESICDEYKGIWQDYWGEKPEWKGRKIVFAGCIDKNATNGTALLIENEHFIITE